MKQRGLFALALSCSLCGHMVGMSLVTIVWPPLLAPFGYPAITFWGAAPASRHAAAGDEYERLKKATPAVSGSDIIRQASKEPIPLRELTDRLRPRVPSSPVEPAGPKRTAAEMPRAVLYRPPPPKYPAGAVPAGRPLTQELRFLIMPDGTVATVENIRSTGYPELDEVGIRHMRSWRFLPVPEHDPAREQWGIITLEFRQP